MEQCVAKYFSLLVTLVFQLFVQAIVLTKL